MSTIDTSYSPPPISAPSSVQKVTQEISSGESTGSTAVVAMAEEMLKQSLGYDQSNRNLNDGVSTAQVADAALEEGDNLIQRMRELATQAASATYSDSNRQALQAEMTGLQDEFSNMVQSTSFNGNNLFTRNGAIQIQAGTDTDSMIGIPTTDLNAPLNSLNFFSLDLSTQAGATSALGILDQSAELITGTRAEVGAAQNQLTARVESIGEQQINTTQARSRMIDTDYAAATANLVREEVLQSAGIAMQAHANASRTDALQLLGV